jgi:hypothetical protein
LASPSFDAARWISSAERRSVSWARRLEFSRVRDSAFWATWPPEALRLSE